MSNQNEELKKAGLKATLPRIKIMEVLASTAIQEEAHFRIVASSFCIFMFW